MLGWVEFTSASAEIGAAGSRLFTANEVAFLATVSKRGRPRVHPFVPSIVEGRLVAFIMDSSPKLKDISPSGPYAIHAWPGPEDEEFMIGGEARLTNDNDHLRELATAAMGFATGVDAHHILCEFFIDHALWTRWLDFGTADHRPDRRRWRMDSQPEI